MSKQACFLRTLKEHIKQKELQRLAFAEREHMVIAFIFIKVLSMQAEFGNFCSDQSQNDCIVLWCWLGKIVKRVKDRKQEYVIIIQGHVKVFYLLWLTLFQIYKKDIEVTLTILVK